MPIHSKISTKPIKNVGRFAPSPSGRMHLGNIFTAMISWLSTRKSGGRWILRIEDLDPQRSKIEHAKMIEKDLQWLGLDWDEGGIENKGDNGPYMQSMRNQFYETAFNRIASLGLTYKCYCSRADIMATQAPHESDGRIIYKGLCRPAIRPPFADSPSDRPCATRIFVPDEDISFTDRVYGRQTVNLTKHCGDFVIKRTDNAWAYQLAVVVDDALMGVTEVVRGNDLLLSAAQQIYLYKLLGQQPPEFAHVPLICNSELKRLSKRDVSLNLEALRATYDRREIIGKMAHMAHIIPEYEPCEVYELIDYFDWNKIPSVKFLMSD